MLSRAAAGDPGGAVEWVSSTRGGGRCRFAAGQLRRGRRGERPGVRRLPCRCAARMRPRAAAGRRDALHGPRPDPPSALAGMGWRDWRPGAIGPRCRRSRWPRLGRYLTYLQISRQRHYAGVVEVGGGPHRSGHHSAPADEAEHSPLRMFTFQRPDGVAGRRRDRDRDRGHRRRADGGRVPVTRRSCAATWLVPDARTSRSSEPAERVDPAWLLRREMARPKPGAGWRVNNVSFVAPGGQRWTLLRNALHFLTDDEAASLDPALRTSVRRRRPWCG